MDKIDISLSIDGSKGRYLAHLTPPADLTYSRASDALIIIDHTGVPDEH